MIPLIDLPPTERGNRIAFYGPMCSGKTYMADYVAQNLDFTKLGFGMKLKAIVKDIFGVEGKNEEARKILQTFADDCKKYDPLVFTKHFLLAANQYERIVCDDMRFVQEADHLRNNGFVLIKVTVPENIRQERIDSLYGYSNAALHQHGSETEYLKIVPDFEIRSQSPKDIAGLAQLWPKKVHV